MPSLHDPRWKPAQWPVQPEMPDVRHSTCPGCTPFPRPPGSDAHRDCPHARRTWPGRDLGVRAPMPGETGLSWAEVHIAMREGQL